MICPWVKGKLWWVSQARQTGDVGRRDAHLSWRDTKPRCGRATSGEKLRAEEARTIRHAERGPLPVVET